jgi:hypothetical protein
MTQIQGRRPPVNKPTEYRNQCLHPTGKIGRADRKTISFLLYYYFFHFKRKKKKFFSGEKESERKRKRERKENE